MPTKSENQVGRNAAVTGFASVIVRLSGLFREVVFAAVFGAGMASDAYNAAFRAAQFFRELVAEGSLSNVFVPIFSRIDEEVLRNVVPDCSPGLLPWSSASMSVMSDSGSFETRTCPAPSDISRNL